ncbi:MAG: hypothetical protein JWM95_1016 [Gemmatimonadetes bacterium]|nr:hypothetical protein [Gemmatimonadota bacterium]
MVTVAVIDSGIASGHPHVGVVSRGILIGTDFESGDFADRIGHGTAVAAAIIEKAPDIELIAVRVFEKELATSAAVLARGITWAGHNGARLINLSLGTPNLARESILRSAVDDAASRGAIVVSAAEVDGVAYLPGSLPGVIGVMLDWDCPRDDVRIVDGRVHASGFPRPIPGISPERNLSGISFAVANATGVLARILGSATEVGTVAVALQLLRERERGS